LLIACANGSLVVAPTRKNSISALPTSSSVKESLNAAKPRSATTPTNPSKTKVSSHPKPTESDEFADSDDDAAAHTEDPSLSPATPRQNRFVDDEAADADDDSIGGAKSTNVQIFGGVGETMTATQGDASDDDDDDIDDYYTSSLPFKPGPTMSLPEPQPAFAPSSSPLDLSRRFMCWNHIGAVTIRRDDLDKDRSTVDINFTDSGVRRPISFTDNLGFVLGSLGEDGGIFATDLLEDDCNVDDNLNSFVSGLSERTKEAVLKSQRKRDPNRPTGSSIYFHRFQTFASLRDKDWYLTLPNGERALGCATGEGWAAVMTRYVRAYC
jgi:Minichromosome loss protein, Mcl1, middle region